MLYKLNRNDIERSERTKIASLSHFGLKEKDLENFLRSRLTDLVSEDELMLIGQERARQPEADLLALDKDGVLYIFELKRWKSRPKDLLQVLGYGQTFGRYAYDDLERLARRHRILESDGSLSDEHQRVFDVSLSPTDFNRDQVFVLVTNGADEDTLSAASYWSSKGLKIFCMPYDVFDIDGEPYLQMRPYNPTGATVVERNTRYYIVNTMPDTWEKMLKSGKAAAYGARRGAVRNIPHGSTVYLYRPGVGIIAKGKSTSSVQNDGDECFVPVNFEWSHHKEEWRSKVPTAREINQCWGSGNKFRNTVLSIDKEKAEKIDKIHEEKQQSKNEDT